MDNSSAPRLSRDNPFRFETTLTDQHEQSQVAGRGTYQGLTVSQKRHHASHRKAMNYPRKRAVTACLRCRARKTKCDNQRPACGFCSGLQVECQYEDSSDHSSFDPASLQILTCLNQILERQDDVLNSVRAMTSGNEQHIITGIHSPWSRENESCQSNSAPGVIDTDFYSLQWESSANYLKIPSSRTTPDVVLSWPIFGSRYPADCFQSAIFELADDEAGSENHSADWAPAASFRTVSRGRNSGFQDTEVVALTERFLSLVHTKNPILDEEMLRRLASAIAEDGLTWDGNSCLVVSHAGPTPANFSAARAFPSLTSSSQLLACALGAIAMPFEEARAQATFDPHTFRQLALNCKPSSLDKAESYYLLARRRVGLLGQNFLASQCFFLSGVYLMYALRPVEAFSEFHQASVLYQICLKRSLPSTKIAQERRLEQRMYWSCFKSECEILSEIPLPKSGIADFDYPHMFPSPPDPASSAASPVLNANDISPSSSSSLRLVSSNTSQRTQEQSWFYYLSEIALRRIGNRILNAFYREGCQQWMNMNVDSLLKVGEEFIQMLEQWHDGLPEMLKYDQTDLSNIPLEELPYMIRARVLEIRSWIFQPFLYHAVHHSSHHMQNSKISSFVNQAVLHSIRLIEGGSLRHRHHGIWYTNRVSATAALSILAAARNGFIKLPEGWESAVQLAIETLAFWEAEAPGDLRKAREILTELLSETVGENAP